MSDALVTVLAGGVGAARMLSGIIQVVDPSQVTAIVNVGDDLELHGLRISPDLDTITYTLAGEINPETGWGLKGESWQAMESVKRYGGISWFGLGDRDLGTHAKATEKLGWEPKTPFPELVNMMVDADIALLNGDLRHLSH